MTRITPMIVPMITPTPKRMMSSPYCATHVGSGAVRCSHRNSQYGAKPRRSVARRPDVEGSTQSGGPAVAAHGADEPASASAMFRDAICSSPRIGEPGPAVCLPAVLRRKGRAPRDRLRGSRRTGREGSLSAISANVRGPRALLSPCQTIDLTLDLGYY